MGAETKIEWTDHTFNAWIGCTKVSEGCRNCYSGIVNCFHHPAEKNAVPMVRVGKKAAGALLDGVEHKAFPETW